MSTLTSPTPTVAPSRKTRVPRAVGFVAVSASLLAFFAAAGAPTPLLPLYERSWGFAPAMLTLAFGVYAIAMIVALLTVGSLSDHVGRRPVLIGALALEAVAMAVFLVAPSIGWVIVARILQGFATGVASSTFGAAIVELASERRKRLGALMSSAVMTGGLGAGALFSGLIALAFPASAEVAVWTALLVVMAIGTVFAVLTPETATRRAGALASLRPALTVPPRVRRLFATTAPTVMAAFLETALFLGLLPTIVGSVFGITVPIAGGLLVFGMFAVAATVAAGSGSIAPHRLRILGDAGLAAGAVGLGAAFALGAFPIVVVATVVSGAGMGAAFSGSTRGLVPEVAAHERAGLLAAVFTIAYVTLGGSAILAGMLAAGLGIGSVAIGFAAVLALVALIGMVLAAVHRPQRGARAS